ncbi:MAG: DUF3800 domain-containing protein [Nitrosospira sp.]
MGKTEEFLVYVDEAGDRGWNDRASPVFAMVAVIIREADDGKLEEALRGLNAAMGRSPESKLHWSEHVRDHQDRKLVARVLAGLPITLITTVLHKDSLRDSQTGLTDSTKQYNYLARRILERISWYLEEHQGKAKLRFAIVRRFPYDGLRVYLERLRQDENCKIKWHTLRNLYVEEVSSHVGLQVADLAAGVAYAALRADRHGDHEPGYLKVLASRLWTGKCGGLQTYGLNIVGAATDSYAQFPWWDEIAEAAHRGTVL